MMRIPERFRDAAVVALRMAIGWHLAYLGVWALTSTWTFSWFGRFQCANWIGSGFFRALAASGAMPVVDAVLAWGLLIAGALLLLGRLVTCASVFGILYLVLAYVLNPPHFGHTGESHLLFIDRNLVEVAMLVVVMTWRRSAGKVEQEVSK